MIEVREFTSADYDLVIRLWQSSDGVTLRDVDARTPLTRYLEQHRGLSFVAVDGNAIVGAVLCGTDGRRGSLQHLAVAPGHRRRGIGRDLAERCVAALSTRGIDKCHLMVVATNADAFEFWSRLGWKDRGDVRLMSRTASGSESA
jgi:ribosomal protein S18 acetylase RimI-like enzyme